MTPPSTAGLGIRDLTWDLDGMPMHATLTVPAGPGPHPAVVMIAGSGPTNRNWNSPLLPGDNGSARLLADVLTREGIASLRYDKRASGPHVRENLPRLTGHISMESHVQEVAAAVDWLRDQPEVDARRIGLLTNSEGALHGLGYALGPTGDRIRALVLTAPPGRTVGELADAQLAAQAAGVPEGDALLALFDAAAARWAAGGEMTIPEELPPGVRQLRCQAPRNLTLG